MQSIWVAYSFMTQAFPLRPTTTSIRSFIAQTHMPRFDPRVAQSTRKGQLRSTAANRYKRSFHARWLDAVTACPYERECYTSKLVPAWENGPATIL